jgi:lantibiotic modifying enzyme
MASWCHGAPGISLTRFALGGAERLREAEAGVPATLAAGAGRLDHLCCGAFGRIETLATASAALHLPALRERALRLAGAVLERRRARGGFALLNGGPGPLPSPALFTGTGGVAYGLLRLAGVPLPSVLLWEPPPSGP